MSGSVRPPSSDGAATLDAANVEETTRSLRALARHLADDDASADDIVQDAWLAMLTGPLSRVRQPRAWLHQVVRFVARRNGRRAARRSEVEQAGAVPSVESRPTPDEVADRAVLASQIRAFITELREPYRTPVELRYFEGLPLREVAKRLDRPAETVRSQVRRGLSELRGRLDAAYGGDRDRWLGLLGLPWLGMRSTRPVVTYSIAVCFVVMVVFVGVWSQTRLPGLPVNSPLARGSTKVAASIPAADAAAAVRQSALLEPQEVSAVDSASSERELEIVVRDQHGAMPDRIEVKVWGRDKRAIGRFGPVGSELRIALAESQLASAPLIPGTHGGVVVTARVPGAAWSPLHLVEVPPRGRSVEIRSGGPGQDFNGFVLDQAGQPIEDAFVAIATRKRGTVLSAEGVPTGERSFHTRTASDGRFEISGLPIRVHRVFVRAAGYVPTRAVVDDPAVAVERSFTLRRGGVVRGTVRLPDGSPAVGAAVSDVTHTHAHEDAGLAPVVADEFGAFELAGLDRGARWLVARRPGEPMLAAMTVVEGGADSAQIWDVTLRPALGLRLRVLEDSGQPAVGAWVAVMSLEDPQWTAARLTDAAGLARFEVVPSATLGCVISRDSADLRPLRRLVGIEPGPEEIVVELPRVKVQSGALTGHVLDHLGVSFRSALVFGASARQHFQVQTDAATGEFEVRDLEPGIYEVWCVAAGSGRVPIGQCEIVAGSERDAGTVRAAAPGQVEFKWRTPGEAVAEHWSIEAVGRGATEGAVVRAIGRSESLVSLLPGRYRLAPPNATRQPLQEFEVCSGERTVVVVD